MVHFVVFRSGRTLRLGGIKGVPHRMGHSFFRRRRTLRLGGRFRAGLRDDTGHFVWMRSQFVTA